MKKKFAYIVASLLGIGFAPIASGTVASFVTVFIAWPLAYFFGVWAILLAVLISFFLGTLATNQVLKYTEHDPSFVVIDEFSGQMLSFIFVAQALQNCTGMKNLAIYVLGFAFFRLFDITKPWLIGKIDRDMQNAWGVMLDDIVAGLFAAICLMLVFIVFF